MDSRLDKLKTVITHAGSLPGERAAALNRLIQMVSEGGGPVTRSVRIGPRRRKSIVSEWNRLDDYAGGRTYGEAIATIYQACKACKVMPVSIDFGFHGSDEAVVAVNFLSSHLPNGLDLQEALRLSWAGARVSATIEQGKDERTYLFYLGVDAPDLHLEDDDVQV